MILNILLGTLSLLGIGFSIIFIKDYVKHKNELENNSFAKLSGIGFLVNFFDALGIGSFAPATALLRIFKQTEDRVIPGTLNVSCTIPVICEAIIFIKVIDVEIITLIVMLGAATIGSWIGAGYVAKLPEKSVQKLMGTALLITAVVMIMSKVGLMPLGGEAIGLTGWKLILAGFVNLILGALMSAGIGLYAPSMAIVFVLGMSPRVAFPIMMGSCAFLMPVGSIKFIKEGSYNRKASLAITIFGTVGVFIAAFLVKSLSLNILTWLVILVVTYTSYTLIKASNQNKNISTTGLKKECITN